MKWGDRGEAKSTLKSAYNISQHQYGEQGDIIFFLVQQYLEVED